MKLKAGHTTTAPPPGLDPEAGPAFSSLQQLASWKNLVLAFRKASRGKRGQVNVAAFEQRLEDNLATLRRELLDRSYTPGAYHSFLIHDPKRRLISAAPFRDRVVHHALINLLGPLLEPGFVAHTYANRKGKGTHRALDRAQALARRFPYVLQLDLRQFFPSIDHEILRQVLVRKVSDPGVLGLIDRILAGGKDVLLGEYDMVSFPGDDLFAVLRPRGLPIGNLTSQFWGNLYLGSLDHFICRGLGGPGYVRYVDDLLLFSESKDWLWQAKARVEDRLTMLRMCAHPGAHPRPTSEGFGFLGFQVFPEARRLKARKARQFRRRLGGLVRGLRAGEKQLAAVLERCRGWANHAGYGNTIGLRRAVLAALPEYDIAC